MKKTLTILCVMVLLVTACGKAEQINSTEGKATESAGVVNLDDYVGYYSDDADETQVTIEKNGAEYSMVISSIRLTTIDEGTVSASSEGIVFDALDAGGNPLKILFYQNDDGTYAFEIKETTWMYFENGETFGNLNKK